MVGFLDGVQKVLDVISTKGPVSRHQIICNTKINPRTVEKYLIFIELIQSYRKLKKEIRRSKVYFKLE